MAFRKYGFTFVWGYGMVKVLTMLIDFDTKYLFQRFVVFGKSLDTAEKQS